MFKAISPGAVGIKLVWPEAAELAAQMGFEGIDVPLTQNVASERIQQVLKDTGMKPAGCGLPVDFRKDEETFQQGLAGLGAVADKGVQVGCVRFPTWLLPFSDELPYKENFDLHARRLGACASVLAERGCRLGLEFVGPKTLRQGHKYEFAHTMSQMLELCEACGENVGLLLDSFHWFTSRGTVEELESLTNDQIVYVHVNDAMAGVAPDEQIDNVRDLPGATGAIDMKGFLTALQKIGYDGPLVPEPFRGDLGEMVPEKAARLVAEAMDNVWKAAGI